MLGYPPKCGPGDPPGCGPGDPPGEGPPMNRMTDRCKNITLPQTSFAGGNKWLNNILIVLVDDDCHSDGYITSTACYL